MRSVHDADGVRVLEDILGQQQLESLEAWAEQVTYQGVHHDRWRTVWRLGEGEPLRGPTWSTSAQDYRRDFDPAGNPLPEALEPLASVLRKLLLTGRNSLDRVSLTPWIYPQGTALGLHRDDGEFDGSYVFYFVPDWDIHWGGLLNCITEAPSAVVPARATLSVTAERSSVRSVGRGIWIAPVRNRLVTLAPHVRHFMSRVDRNAGDRPRLSIAGFIHRAT
jgi:hypothetical protein